MGISLSAAKMLMEVGKPEGFSGSVLQLGRQNLYFGSEDLERAADRMGFRLRPADPEPLVGNKFLPEAPLVVGDRFFFKALGFDEVHSCDASDFEDPSFVFDLNSETLPPDRKNSYDLVVDGGTLEHVFHLPNALKNIVGFLKPGAMIVHMAPVHNYFEHGFYCFNPTLFHDYYSANGFEIISSHLVRSGRDARAKLSQRVNLLPAQVEFRHYCQAGSLDDNCYSIFFVARKKGACDGAIIPQQSAYLDAWAGDMRDGESGRQRKSTARRLLKKISKRNKSLLMLYQRTFAWLEKRSVRWEDI